MPGVPFLDPHAEEVEVLLHLSYQGGGLEDMLILFLHIFRDPMPGVEMGQTKLSSQKSFQGEALVLNIFAK